MKLLFASRKTLAPLGEGGGETIAFDLLSALESRGLMGVKALGAFHYPQLEALGGILRDLRVNLSLEQQAAEIETGEGTIAYPAFAHVTYRMPDSPTTTLAREDHFQQSFAEYLRQYNPDVALLQAEGFIECWRELRERRDVRTFFYVQNGYEPARFKDLGIGTPRLLANSEFVKRKVKDQFGYDSDVLYPAIQAERYHGENPAKSGQFTVLFVNPIAVKGLAIFLHLADRFPSVQFLALEGWSKIEGKIFQMLSSRPNITCLPKTWNMAQIYAVANLLVAPSQWQEAFGRVVVEAHAAGVPTLASRVGGLPEASGAAGLLVDDYANPSAWETALREIVNQPAILETRRPLLEGNARRFNPDLAAQRFAELAAS